MNKDWLKPGKKEDQPRQRKLKSNRHPSGRDRKNRLNRNFDEDISIKHDRDRMKNNEGGGGSFDPHEYL
jgi:hypothetical protein